MLSFEEFFTKKRIDLLALRQSDANLYEEFKSHYALMGEKSFDHSKKFWFNKLRKSFLLPDQEAVANTEKPLANEVDKQKAVSNSKLPFKSKFAASKINKEEAKDAQGSGQDVTKTTTVSEETSKPAGFKPRFKAGVTKATEQPVESMASENKAEENPIEPTSKPTGFKPRFKVGVTKTAEQPAENIASENKVEENPIEPTSKPTGFKPRFKAGVTKVAEQPAENIASENKAKENPIEPTSKPTGFKPRFKAGVTKVAEQPAESKASENKAGENPIEPTSKPTGFKPRFKAGVTKTKPSEDNS